MKHKVAIIDNSTGKTGALSAIMNYTEYTKGEFDFTYILPKESTAVELVTSKGYKVIQMPFLELSKNFTSIILYLPFLLINAFHFKRIIQKNQIGLVHSNDFYNLIAPISKAIGGDFKILTHIRFMPNRFPVILQNIWLKIHSKYSEKILCVSDAVKNHLPKNKKIQTIYDGLPKGGLKKKEISQTSTTKLLYLAHYIPGKGQNFAIKAYVEAFQLNPTLRLEFVGGDLGLEKNKAYKNSLEKVVQDIGLTKLITFSGEIKDTSSKMIEADIFLNFSESESFSMTTLEALSLGVPTIVSDCGGPAELFEHNQSGILVPNENVDEMAKSILNLASDSDLRTKFSVNSVQYVQRKFSMINTYEKLKNIYNQVIKNEN